MNWNRKAIFESALILLLAGALVGCGSKEETKEDPNPEVKDQEEVKANYSIVEAMKHIEATNTVEEINAIIGFEATTDAMIGSDPIWKFDSDNWISFETFGDDDVTIRATIDKESIKNDNISIPKTSDLQEALNNGSFTYEELVQKIGGEGTLTSISKGSRIYTWVDKSGIRLSATFNNESGKCTIASYR